MANIKSMKKDLRRNAKKRVVTQGVKSALKTYIKKAKVTGTDEAVNSAQAALDKAAQRGLIHKNQAARRKSRMMKAANAVTPAEPVAAAPKAEKKAAAPKKEAAAKKAPAKKAAKAE